MNDVTVVDNLTADPVYRVSERNGRGVVRFNLAVNRRRFDRETNQYDNPPDRFSSNRLDAEMLIVLAAPEAVPLVQSCSVSSANL